MEHFNYLKTSARLLLVSLVLGLSTPNSLCAERDEWLSDAEVSFSAEDNVNHAIYDTEAQNDQVWSGLVSLGRIYYFSGFSKLDIGAQLDGSVHHEFSGLNQLDTRLKIGFRHKFGVGPFKPWIKGYIAPGYIFSRSKIREGYHTQAGIDLGKPLNKRIDLVLGYRFDHRDSRNTNPISTQKLEAAGFDPGISSAVYDITGHAEELHINALLTQRLLLSLGYAYRDGDFVSTSRPSLASRHRSVADAIVRDDALPGWAYRADGITHSYSVDASNAFMQGDASLHPGYQYTQGRADAFTYRNNLFRMSFVYHF